MTTVTVPRKLQERCKLVTTSLALHDAHNRAAGQPFNFARHAARAAPITEREKLNALKVHRAANKAKHSLPHMSETDTDVCWSSAALAANGC